jgi:chorismate--pyruvate lyase
MSSPGLKSSAATVQVSGTDAWLPLSGCETRAPQSLLPWLAEPGLLTARVRAACGEAMSLRMPRLERTSLALQLRDTLGVEDADCLMREVEIGCGTKRWIFAQSVFPVSTVGRYPWLGELGDNGLGEALARVEDVRREPLEYAELAPAHQLARAAFGGDESSRAVWARRAIYRLGGWPILVQEVFLPGLGNSG